MSLNLHKLSLKLAGAVAGGTLLAGLLVYVALAAVPFWAPLAGALVVGGIAYAAAYRLLAPRLKLAGTTLRQIRRHQFENLESIHLPKGDELNDLIWQAYRTGQALEREIQELKKMENYRREFIGNVSHEFKTPIFAIQGFSETLLDGALEDERVRQSFVEKILRNANRMNNLARDLAEIARIETGELQMTVAPFDMKKLVREINESLELTARQKNITLQHQLPGDLPPVVGDRDRIRQVLTNLVDNAVKYNNPGGRVEVSARQLPSGAVKVTVDDDGIGISEEHLERLTERFYRVDRSRSRDQGGTGLGLAIVKHILGAHDTRLTIDSISGQGSTFSFTLPTVDLEKDRERESKRKGDGKAGGGSKKRPADARS